MGEEVWAQLADGTCRWRQTSSQLTIVCLKVQRGTPAKQLQVTLDLYFIKGLLPCFIPLLLPKTIQFVDLQNTPEYQKPPLSCLAMYLPVNPLGQTWFMAQLCAPIRELALLIRLQPARA